MNEVSQAVFLTMAQNAGSGPSGVYSMFLPSGIAAVYGVGIILVFFVPLLSSEGTILPHNQLDKLLLRKEEKT